MDPAKALDSHSNPVVTGTPNTNTPAKGINPVMDDVKPGILKFSKGIENAKKRLRAFSIQKKTPITPVIAPKPSTGGTTTVLIGKLSNVKPTVPKVDDEQKKIPKPPKPGSHKKSLQESYVNLQKRTLAEIEDMKRKMELVELGIPLGLICPTSTSEKAMPTKAMPPIKHFLGASFRIYSTQRSSRKPNLTKLKNHSAKVDEIIREAKKARDEGKKYKFDYQKILPNYDNPFQRKKEEDRCKTPEFRSRGDFDRNKRKSDRYDSRRHFDHRRDERDRYKTRDKERHKGGTKEKKFEQEKEKKASINLSKEIIETNVNLNDYLVCDSWSLDNEDRNSSSPKSEDRSTKKTMQPAAEVKCENAVPQLIRDSAIKNKNMLREYTRDSPVRPYIKESPLVPIKMAKLQPVIDSFKFEIDPNDEEILDIFDEDSGIEKYARKEKVHTTMYSPTDMKLIEYDEDESKDVSVDTNDDNFLESVINEIKQEEVNEDISQDKALVEYDISPINKEAGDSKTANIRLSVTPELDDRMRDVQSQRSDYSDGYRSNESGYKTSDTTESGYKSIDSFRMSVEKEQNEDIGMKMSKSTVDSLETWSFVLKICQPILFRHDKNKCYRETRVMPKLWYTENPRLCNCVKDRKVVYEELHLCKMNLVDRVYGCDQIPDAPSPKCRNWYPRPHLCLTENHTVPVSQEWEGEDMRQNEAFCRLEKEDSRRRSNTPQQSEEVCLDSEYQKFMKAVWPEVTEDKIETPRSTTPVKPEGKKKKREEVAKEVEMKKSAKKLKLSSEGWSQESDLEEEIQKSKKMKIDKERLRKRKRSSSTMSSFSESEPEAKKKKKAMKKNILKKSKWKSAKRRRIGKKLLRKLKEKKKKRSGKIEKIDGSDDDDSDKKISKKLQKKKQQKLKKKNLKRKKKEVSISSSTSSSSDSSSDESEKRSKKSKRSSSKTKKDKRRKRKSTSDSAQSEELFDVNILNNIKTERLTDDEKSKSLMDFSPRRQQKPREIINVKELQNDFVGNNIHIKKEIIEETTKNFQETRTELAIESEVNLESPDKMTEVSKEVKEVLQYIPAPISVVSATVSLVSPTISQTVPKIDLISTVPPAVPQTIPTISHIKSVMEESNMSQGSSQESVCSVKPYEKDDSHLRPSSQNSNYSFNDVINASQSGLYQKSLEPVVECEDKFHENYQHDNYEMFEHLAMAYQSDVASHQASPPCSAGEQRIETVVRARSRGEIKCDWRAGLSPAVLPPPAKPSRWGLKPGEVNIVLTGGGDYAPQPTTSVQQQQQQQQQQQSLPEPQTVQPVPAPQPVYKIQSLANRTDLISGYDEAYMDMYGAADRLQYGDCFSEGASVGPENIPAVMADVIDVSAPVIEVRTSTLDARIDYALKTTVLGEVAKEVESSPPADEKEAPEKGILIGSGAPNELRRVSKRVSFADGYKPGQDSDVEDPPVKKKRKVRRTGCAWPCPATHPDHVALWDALPPPPPPPGSPPPPHRAAPPLHLLRAPPALTHRPGLNIPMALPPRLHKIGTNSPLPVFIPTEPPPSLVNFP